jgi:hypothetical protein
MKKRFIIPFIVSVIVIGAGLARQTIVLGNTTKSYERSESQLAESEFFVAATRSSLLEVEEELDDTKSQLKSSKTELASIKDTLATTESNLATSKVSLNRLQASLGDLQYDFSNLKTNYDRMTEGFGYILRDPTYQEVKNFLISDNTNSHLYNTDTYNCANFSADVAANAAKMNIRCGFVNVSFIDGAHAIVVFNTTDKGIIFVEPQSDVEMNLQIGKKYWQSAINHSYANPGTYDDTVVKYIIIW